MSRILFIIQHEGRTEYAEFDGKNPVIAQKELAEAHKVALDSVKFVSRSGFIAKEAKRVAARLRTTKAMPTSLEALAACVPTPKNPIPLKISQRIAERVATMMPVPFKERYLTMPKALPPVATEIAALQAADAQREATAAAATVAAVEETQGQFTELVERVAQYGVRAVRAAIKEEIADAELMRSHLIRPDAQARYTAEIDELQKQLAYLDQHHRALGKIAPESAPAEVVEQPQPTPSPEPEAATKNALDAAHEALQSVRNLDELNAWFSAHGYGLARRKDGLRVKAWRAYKADAEVVEFDLDAPKKQAWPFYRVIAKYFDIVHN